MNPFWGFSEEELEILEEALAANVTIWHRKLPDIQAEEWTRINTGLLTQARDALDAKREKPD
jgi:hypothetical protein